MTVHRSLIRVVAAAAIVGCLASGSVAAQSGSANAPADKALIPIRLLVVISRHQNEKRISNVPYTLWLNANEGRETKLVMGNRVPVPQPVFSPGAPAGAPSTAYSYQSLGTNISAAAASVADGRFNVQLQVEDTFLVPASTAETQVAHAPTIASISANQLVLLRDGQTAEVLSATNKLTGEVTKIEVTLTVLK